MQLCGDCQPRLLLANLLSGYQAGTATTICKSCKDLLTNFFPTNYFIQGGDGNYLFLAPYLSTCPLAGTYTPSSVPGVFLFDKTTPTLNVTGGTYTPSSRAPVGLLATGVAINKACQNLSNAFSPLERASIENSWTSSLSDPFLTPANGTTYSPARVWDPRALRPEFVPDYSLRERVVSDDTIFEESDSDIGESAKRRRTS